MHAFWCLLHHTWHSYSMNKDEKMCDYGCKPQHRTDHYHDYSFLSIAFPFLSRQSLEDNSMVQPTRTWIGISLIYCRIIALLIMDEREKKLDATYKHQKSPLVHKMKAERMFDIHRIGKTNEFTTATYPKTFITNLIQRTFRSKINLIQYP